MGKEKQQEGTSLSQILNGIVDNLLCTRNVDLGILGGILDALIALIDGLSNLFPKSQSDMSEDKKQKLVKYVKKQAKNVVDEIDNFQKEQEGQNLSPEEEERNAMLNYAKELAQKKIIDPEKIVQINLSDETVKAISEFIGLQNTELKTKEKEKEEKEIKQTKVQTKNETKGKQQLKKSEPPEQPIKKAPELNPPSIISGPIQVL